MKTLMTLTVVLVLAGTTAVSPSFASGRVDRLAAKVHHVQKQNKHLRWKIRSLRYDMEAHWITLGCWLGQLYEQLGVMFPGGALDSWCESFYAAPQPDPPPPN